MLKFFFFLVFISVFHNGLLICYTHLFVFFFPTLHYDAVFIFVFLLNKHLESFQTIEISLHNHDLLNNQELGKKEKKNNKNIKEQVISSQFVYAKMSNIFKCFWFYELKSKFEGKKYL